MGITIVLILGGIILYLVFTQGSKSVARASQARETAAVPHRDRSRRVTPSAQARSAGELWNPPGQDARAAGFTIPGGMVYVGEELAPVRGWQVREPALIDPTLPIARRDSDTSGDGMSYWPSYSEIPPECRTAYLEWLAGGRSDPEAYIGYVFLFFYGLERRLLFDLRHVHEPVGEVESLLVEVGRLLSLYGSNKSFRGYATSLLHTARALYGTGQAYQRAPSFVRGSGSLATDVRVAVGQLLNAGEPVTGNWALAWVLGHPETRLRTPARRCPDEFRDLFLLRFTDKFGAGMMLKPNKRRLRLSHVPASASFGGAVDIPFNDLPDVGGLSRPIAALRKIAETASSELESFSRFVGRNPDRATSLEALALLPPELAGSRENPEAERLRLWVESLLSEKEHVVTAGSNVMEHWACTRDDRMRKGELGSFARMLELFGYGVEPDPRFGGGAIRTDDRVVFFRPGAGQHTAATPSYRAATLLLHLAAAVATSDGSISEEEERHVEEHLERSMGLDEAEIRRLRAHLHWLLVSKPTMTGVKRRINEISEGGRHHVAQFAVAIAGADGVIDPEEIKSIVKIYRLLGLDPDEAYADIHSLKTDSRWRPADEPVAVRPAERAEAGYAIPERPTASSSRSEGTFALDMDRIERTLVETATVSGVLAEIFAEQDGSEPGVVTDASVGIETRAGLDPAHTVLLRQLENHQELSRDHFEGLVEELGLLADGAIETLNEAAFDQVDAPLLEGEDLISIDRDTLGEMIR